MKNQVAGFNPATFTYQLLDLQVSYDARAKGIGKMLRTRQFVDSQRSLF